MDSPVVSGKEFAALVPNLRSQFPALEFGSESSPVFLDAPGGTQVPQSVLDAMSDYLIGSNANTHGAYASSQRTDALIKDARETFADFFNAPSESAVAFGANMTSLTFHLSRSIGKTLAPGDEIIVTRLDHDANISPWLALEEQGVRLRWLEFNPKDCTLNLDALESLFSRRTKLVAVGWASNAVGTINPIHDIVERAHAAGALVYVDAVHYAPHRHIDVTALDCDFLVCSAYKFFGPHVGVLYGKADALDSLPAYKIRPQEDAIPLRFETGTLNHEGLAGAMAAVDYLAGIGRELGAPSDRRSALGTAMSAIEDYEQTLSKAFIDGLSVVDGVRVYGIADNRRLSERTPTISFAVSGNSPRAVAEQLGARNIYVTDGDYYAPEVMRSLDIDPTIGLVRVGAAHYITPGDINYFVDVVADLK